MIIQIKTRQIICKKKRLPLKNHIISTGNQRQLSGNATVKTHRKEIKEEEGTIAKEPYRQSMALTTTTTKKSYQ